MGIGSGISKSEVSRICAGLDEQIAAFRDRPLHHTAFPYVFLDATYLHVRRTGPGGTVGGGQVTSMAVVVATAVTADGGREILGLDVGDSEDEVFWRGFLRTLKQRGLHGVQLVISDQHAGLVAALGRVFQGVGHQRCRVHFARNLLALVPKSHKDMVAAVFRTAFAQPDPEAASRVWDQVRDQLAATFPKIGPLMDTAKAEVLAFTAFPPRPLGEDLVHEPVGADQPRDQTTGPCRWHLPQRGQRHPPRRRRPQRPPRRMASLRPPLPLRRLHGQAQPDQRYWTSRRNRSRRLTSGSLEVHHPAGLNPEVYSRGTAKPDEMVLVRLAVDLVQTLGNFSAWLSRGGGRWVTSPRAPATSTFSPC